MRSYAVFGGRLLADLDFPELRPLADAGAPDWTLKTRDGPAEPPTDATLLGEEDFPLYGSSLRLWRTAGGFRLAYSDTGVFDVSADGRAVVWYRSGGESLELVRMDVMGRVLATALHAAGAIALHASAVAAGEGAVGFMAPKFHGKSTLALALTYAGGRLITDDTMAVLPGTPATCIPGVHSVRLRRESAAHFPRTQGLDAAASGRVVDELPDHMLMSDPAPLAALYVLAPVPAAQADVPVRRVRIASVPATLAVLGYAKMGSLFRDTEATANFDRAAALAGRVPVYRLEIVRALDQLDGVAREILAWHGGVAVPAAATALASAGTPG